MISSAIAIPSVSSLGSTKREFVIFESSLSDILGVLFFNFVALNHEININSVGHFILQIVIILLVSLISTIGISFLLTRIRYHVKYIPILLIVILVYAVSKIVHLPGLVFVLVCGIFLGNVGHFKFNRWVQKLQPDEVAGNVNQFKKITVEFTFVIRVMFFILFVAPRGLITILLFFLILPESRIPLVNKSLITQVILITAFTMLFGLMFAKKESDSPAA